MIKIETDRDMNEHELEQNAADLEKQIHYGRWK